MVINNLLKITKNIYIKNQRQKERINCAVPELLKMKHGFSNSLH